MGFFSSFFNSRPPDNQNSQFRGWASSPEAINGSFSSEHQRQQQSLAQQMEWQRVRRAQHHIYEEREAELLSAFEEERLSWGERMEAFFGRMMETINDLLGHIDEQEDSFSSEIDNLRDEIRDLENQAQQPPTGCCGEPPDSIPTNPNPGRTPTQTSRANVPGSSIGRSPSSNASNPGRTPTQTSRANVPGSSIGRSPSSDSGDADQGSSRASQGRTPTRRSSADVPRSSIGR